MSDLSDDWTVVRMLEWATEYFENKKVPSPRLSIEWLLSHVLEIKRLQLYMQYDRPLTNAELDKIRPLVLRRGKHEPLQYITGSTEFFNSEILVNPAVLIPRPETEELVERILNDFPESKDNFRLLDLGTGSGCIPIAIKKERPDWDILGMDVSPEALDVAKSNAETNDTEIEFLLGDFTKNWDIAGSFDVIVSNPPYVLSTEKEKLDIQVRDYEPALALFTDNLSDIFKPIINQAQTRLKTDGKLYFELHEDYAQQVLAFFDEKIWQARIISDYAAKERFIEATIR